MMHAPARDFGDFMRHRYALTATAASVGLIVLAIGAPYALREVIAAFVLFTVGFAALSFLAGIGMLLGAAGKAGGHYARSRVLTTDRLEQLRAVPWLYLWNALKHRLSIPTVSSPIQ
jgi:hypothetical protein